MSRPRRINPKLVAKARAVAARATDINDLRAAQAVLLPALAHKTLEETAVLLGVGRATVPRLQQRFREGLQVPRAAPKRWGGRRRALLTPAEEQAFLAPWVEQARGAGVLVVSPLRAALAAHLGRQVAPSVVYRLLARHGWRRVAPDTRHPKHDPLAQAAWKKLPGTLATLLTPEVVASRPVRVMFQDEARFGRMVRPKRCWAPAPLRPTLRNAYAREFVYVYGAVSPLAGELDWRLCREMNTLRMGEFLTQVGQAHPTEFIVMVVDGASSHTAKDLAIPDNIRLLPLPPYAPELNPQEHVWDELREKEFPNRVFNHLDAVIRQLEHGLPRLAADAERLRSLTAWPWIVSLNLNAH